MSLKSTAAEAAKPFVGTRRLESFTESTQASGLLYPLGATPTGLLIYTEDGFVSAQLMKPGRKELSADLWGIAHADGLAELAEGYIGYCGRFTVDEKSRQVVHTPIVALIPNLIDHDQVRTYSLDGQRLILETLRSGADGFPIETRLVWRKG